MPDSNTMPGDYQPTKAAKDAYEIHRRHCLAYGVLPEYQRHWCWEWERCQALDAEKGWSEMEPRPLWPSSLHLAIREQGESARQMEPREHPRKRGRKPKVKITTAEGEELTDD